jgi:hypothetical protein
MKKTLLLVYKKVQPILNIFGFIIIFLSIISGILLMVTGILEEETNMNFDFFQDIALKIMIFPCALGLIIFGFFIPFFLVYSILVLKEYPKNLADLFLIYMLLLISVPAFGMGFYMLGDTIFKTDMLIKVADLIFNFYETTTLEPISALGVFFINYIEEYWLSLVLFILPIIGVIVIRFKKNKD